MYRVGLPAESSRKDKNKGIRLWSQEMNELKEGRSAVDGERTKKKVSRALWNFFSFSHFFAL